ncbi:MAG: helix-turn-helix domain-containing protein [bacterium]
MNFNNHHSNQGTTMSPSAGVAQSSRISGAPSWGPDNPGKQMISRATARFSPQLQKMERKNTIASISSNNKIPEKLVNGNRMADAISVSTRTLKRLRRDGIISFYRVGRSIRYDLGDVMQSLTDYQVKSRAQMSADKATRTR